MLLAMVAALGLLQQPEPEKSDIFKPGSRFLPGVGIPERNEEPGRINIKRSTRPLLPVAPPPRPKVDTDVSTCASEHTKLGRAAAEADIKAGKPTIRVLTSLRGTSARYWLNAEDGPRDEATGLRIVYVFSAFEGSGDAAAAYNEVIRAWHAKQQKK